MRAGSRNASPFSRAAREPAVRSSPRCGSRHRWDEFRRAASKWHCRLRRAAETESAPAGTAVPGLCKQLRTNGCIPGRNCGGRVMPASTTCAPAFCSATIICSRLARVVETGRPRSPSLPPNSRMAIDRLQSRHRMHALDAVGGGIAADAGVHHPVAVSAPVQFLLQKVGITLAGIGAEASREAVAERDDHGAIIRRRRRARRALAAAGFARPAASRLFAAATRDAAGSRK